MILTTWVARPFIASSCFSPFPDGLGEKMSGFRLGLQGLGEARLISSTATRCKISCAKDFNSSRPLRGNIWCAWGPKIAWKMDHKFLTLEEEQKFAFQVKTAAGCYNRVPLPALISSGSPRAFATRKPPQETLTGKIDLGWCGNHVGRPKEKCQTKHETPWFCNLNLRRL